MKNRKRNKKGGFSLLELLAVVTILGIIAAIIVPRVTVSSDTAKQRVRDHHKATINSNDFKKLGFKVKIDRDFHHTRKTSRSAFYAVWHQASQDYR